jgi:hypothetical protein
MCWYQKYYFELFTRKNNILKTISNTIPNLNLTKNVDFTYKIYWITGVI